MVGMHIGLLSVVSFADLTFGMFLLHLFTFDPAWIPRRIATRPEYIFYDGNCALCHGWVRFVLAEDSGKTFRLSPLQGERFLLRAKQENFSLRSDSVVVLTEDEEFLVRSEAMLYVLRSLGGLWLVLAVVAGVIPRRIRDWCYDRVASVRLRIFGTSKNVCPMMPEQLKERFEL